MPKIENFATHIKIDGNPFAKNTINYQVQSGDTVGLYYTNDRDRRILEKTLARFDDWTNLNDVAYSSYESLIADLDLFLFSNTNDPIQISLGNIPGKKTVNKFGRAVLGVQTTQTDIWDRADDTPSQSIWLAPTAARIHTIASTSVQDTTGGTGIDEIEIFYLTDWDSKEKSETITGDINAGIAMSEAAVIIHRMIVTPQATTTNNNVGIITATAAVDATITAEINANEGQTQMAIYGIPSIQTFLLDDFYGTINKAQGSAASINFRLIVNSNPNIQTVSYVIKNIRGTQSTGANGQTWNFKPPLAISGPAIIKVQGIGSTSDLEGSAGFNGVLIDT